MESSDTDNALQARVTPDDIREALFTKRAPLVKALFATDGRPEARGPQLQEPEELEDRNLFQRLRGILFD